MTRPDLVPISDVSDHPRFRFTRGELVFNLVLTIGRHVRYNDKEAAHTAK